MFRGDGGLHRGALTIPITNVAGPCRFITDYHARGAGSIHPQRCSSVPRRKRVLAQFDDERHGPAPVQGGALQSWIRGARDGGGLQRGTAMDNLNKYLPVGEENAKPVVVMTDGGQHDDRERVDRDDAATEVTLERDHSARQPQMDDRRAPPSPPRHGRPPADATGGRGTSGRLAMKIVHVHLRRPDRDGAAPLCRRADPPAAVAAYIKRLLQALVVAVAALLILSRATGCCVAW